MTREEALELVERMPYIRTIMVANDKLWNCIRVPWHPMTR